jgi:hypothetical protein
MAERHLLIIGSQCDKLNRLSFLPEIAIRLHKLLNLVVRQEESPCSTLSR